MSQRLSSLLALARNDDAGRLFGVEGALEGQLDITFFDDPLDWIAYDIAQAIKAADGDGDVAGPTLTLLVAELRLYGLMKGQVDEASLSRLVHEYVEADED